MVMSISDINSHYLWNRKRMNPSRGLNTYLLLSIQAQYLNYLGYNLMFHFLYFYTMIHGFEFDFGFHF